DSQERTSDLGEARTDRVRCPRQPGLGSALAARLRPGRGQGSRVAGKHPPSPRRTDDAVERRHLLRRRHAREVAEGEPRMAPGRPLGDFAVTLEDCGATKYSQLLEAAPALAGNAFASAFVRLADGRMYLYHNDESVHGGVHRWRIEGEKSLALQTIELALAKKT